MTTATETETTTRTALVEAQNLMRVITNAALAASHDDTLPALTTIHFRPGHQPGRLMLEATNRYIASQEEIDLEDLADYDSDWYGPEISKHLEEAHGIEKPSGYDRRTETELRGEHETMHDPTADHEHSVRPVPETTLDVLVNVKDCIKLVKTLKLVIEPDTKYAAGSARPHVRIDHTEGEGKVSFTLVNNLGTETTITQRKVEGEYVKIDALQPELADIPEQEYQFNADYLAVFTKVDTGERMAPVKLGLTAKGKPVIVTVGERYRGMIVPIRNGS